MIAGRVYKILLIDDDVNCLDSIGQILRRDGYEVTAVDDGRKALNMFPKSNFDLVIVDLHLPDVDGIYVLKEIRKSNGKVPVIVMTSDTSKESKFSALEAGAYSFIAKPINIPSFRNIVAKALENVRFEVKREMILIRWFREIIHR